MKLVLLAFLILLLTHHCLNCFAQGIVLPAYPHDELRNRTDFDLKLKIPGAIKLTQTEFNVCDPPGRETKKEKEIKEYLFSEEGSVKKLNLKARQSGALVVTFDFDRYGRIIHEKTTENQIANYVYEEAKRTITCYWFSKDSVFSSKGVVFFNEDLRMIRREAYEGDSILSHSDIYEYNSGGDLVCKMFINTPRGPGITIDFQDYKTFKPAPNDTTLYFVTYSGDTTTIRRIKPFPEITKKFHINDTLVTEFIIPHSNNNSFRKVTKEIGDYRKEVQSLSGRSTTYYYKGNDLTLVEYFVKGKKKETDRYDFTYKTDSKNNWIEKLTFKNSEPYYRIERKITYKD